MKKTKQDSLKRTLKLRRETIRALTNNQMEQMDGGTWTLPPTPTIGCAGSNNSCDICHQN